ncbi:alpha-keto acid decarboxylase family protein [Aspergillus candidus]|uniref:Pyruvate decarboxylase n=1 Tax=Aspergillus candidus TaxID=41067 RepID=A0A2I2FI30_ASPCN|nr:thiamine diphosphate-binding protein [Aspergillus candidus]PLB40272.1 thiamine diphosphate-binding protein [Aspergillus candidus]
MSNSIPLGRYLWTRIHQQGCKSIMGLPGDMNLELLDYINDVNGLNWVGNTNELNAAYAADGYARVKNCPGVIVTTMGVGELSALNGVAGAYTEQVKLIHIVGTTSTEVQKKRLMIHHCLGPDPDHRVYEKISENVRCTHAWLDNAETAATEIDRVVSECWIRSLPVYIFVPMNFVHTPLPLGRLNRPLKITLPVNVANEQNAVKNIIQKIVSAKNPVVLVDCLAARHEAGVETRQLVNTLDFPTFATSMGKSIVNETHPRFCGIYNGEVSYPGVKLAVERSDCIINIGPLLADSNTGGHTRGILPEQVVLIEPDTCTVSREEVLRKLLVAVREMRLPVTTNPALPPQPDAADAHSNAITQSWIWKRLGNFTRAGDILIAESGTAQFGFPDADLAADARYVTQVYYGSIGYTVGACLGAAIAQREIQAQGGMNGGRTILVVGDGSLQLTVQEISTMIRMGLHPLILIINNDGYTIERAIHGAEEEYNGIDPWRFQKLLDFFGAQNSEASSHLVTTKEELEHVLALPEYESPTTIQLLEIRMDQMDIPWRLRDQIAIVNARIQSQKAKQSKQAQLKERIEGLEDDKCFERCVLKENTLKTVSNIPSELLKF